MKNFKCLMMSAAFASALFSVGAQATKNADFDKDAIAKVLEKYQLKIANIEASPVNGLFEIVTDGGVVYATPNGEYFIYGQLFHTTETLSVNLTERAQAKRNKALFEQSGVEKELIVYPAKNEKYVVTVFTDTSCGYCKKLHKEMKTYNDLGITVRYLAFPRSGERSPNIAQMSAIWCADDKIKAMDLAKVDKFDKEDKKCTDLVLKHMKLGTAMGVSGTPAILLDDGTILSGYLPAKQLVEVLEKKALENKVTEKKSK